MLWTTYYFDIFNLYQPKKYKKCNNWLAHSGQSIRCFFCDCCSIFFKFYIDLLLNLKWVEKKDNNNQESYCYNSLNLIPQNLPFETILNLNKRKTHVHLKFKRVRRIFVKIKSSLLRSRVFSITSQSVFQTSYDKKTRSCIVNSRLNVDSKSTQ